MNYIFLDCFDFPDVSLFFNIKRFNKNLQQSLKENTDGLVIKRDSLIQNITVIPDSNLSDVQNAAFSRILKYRSRFNTSELNLNDSLNEYATKRAVQFANQDFVMLNNESVFSVCQYPAISNYQSRLLRICTYSELIIKINLYIFSLWVSQCNVVVSK